jgi:hypothetical protein
VLSHRCFHAFNAMNVVDITKVARSSARGESQCEYCGRPWFGLVAYCPYCGRKPSFTTISKGPDDRVEGDAALAGEQSTAGMPAGELQRQEAKSPAGEPHRQEPKPPRKEPRATPLPFKALAAGVSVLLLSWMAVKLPAPKTTEVASPQPPISPSGIASPKPSASTTAAQVPSIPPRTAAAVPPKPVNRSLCSVANEAVGLCKSQK